MFYNFNMERVAEVRIMELDRDLIAHWHRRGAANLTICAGDALRLKREIRIYNPNQHNLCPIPQGELDKVRGLTQNPGW